MPEKKLNTGKASICKGCSKTPGFVFTGNPLTTGWMCTIYADPRKTFGHRMGGCYFNNKAIIGPKMKIRVGQQKGKAQRGKV